MRAFWLALQEHGGQAAPGGDAHVASPFDINQGLIVWTLVVFGILLALLWRFAWPAILKSVEERERKIQRQLDEAEQSRVEAARLLEEHKRLVAGARGEAAEILARAKQVAEKERENLIARARHEADEQLVRARREIEEETRKAILALRKEAVDLAIAGASKVIEENLDAEKNRKLVMEYLAGLAEGGGRAQ